MYNYYVLSIKGKNAKYFVKCLLKNRINIYDAEYKPDTIILKVSYDDYKRIKKFKTSCKIDIIGVYGIRRVKQLFQKYKVPISIFVISVFFIMLISNIVLFVDIDTNEKSLNSVIKNELKNNHVFLFSRKKSYKSLSSISSIIRNNHLDLIEWIELEQKGVVLKVKVIQRIDNDNVIDSNYNDIVASKDGYIKNIYSRNGQVVKNIGDYVKKGEVIISGNIFRNDKVVGRVDANGKVFAEVWYISKISNNLNYNYYQKENLGELSIDLFINGARVKLFKIKKQLNEPNSRCFFSNNSFSLCFCSEPLYTSKIEKYSQTHLKEILEKRARDDMMNKLKEEDYIISQKTLKKYIKNGKMYIEVFFKCYEDIALERDIQEIKEKKEE